MDKLNIEFPKKPDHFSQDEWEARVDLAACYRLANYYGWTVTVRPGSRQLLGGATATSSSSGYWFAVFS